MFVLNKFRIVMEIYHKCIYNKIKCTTPGAIVITTSGVGSVNSFSNSFVRFDNTTNTFDEDVSGGNTRASASAILTSYDETGTTFDTTTIKYSNG